jgi:hypothetical protein
MITGRKVTAVAGALDLSGKPDCRGAEFQDPGGFGLLRFEGGLIATVDAADYGKGPGYIIVNGTLGRAVIAGMDMRLEHWDGTSEHWPNPDPATSSMDRAVAGIVSFLDGTSQFPHSAADSVRVLEVIIAFHVSHGRNSGWVELPLKGSDRELELRSA